MSMKQLAQELASKGRGGDTILAHITPEEAALLKARGGAGTINPETGLPEYNILKDLWNGLKKVVKKAAPILLPAVAIFTPWVVPAIGTALGASAALAPVVGAAALSAGVTAVSGGSISDIISSAALAGVGSYLSPILGDFVGDKFGVTSTTLKSMIGSASYAGALTAVRGGTVNDILVSAATGGLTNYLTQMASNIVNGNKITNMNIKQKTFEEALFAAADAEGLHKAGLEKNEIIKVLNTSGLNPTVTNYVADMASKGVSAEEIATGIANRFSNAHGTKEAPTFYRDGVNKNAAELAVSGGANVKALEVIQQLEDASFVYDDAKNLKAAGLKETEIVQNLRAAGVPEALARQAAADAVRGATDGAASIGILNAADRAKITTIIGEPEGVTTKTGTIAARDLGSEAVKEETFVAKAKAETQKIIDAYQPSQTPTGEIDLDAEFMKADYDQLRAQNVSREQARDTLIAAGVDPKTANVFYDGERSGWSDATLMSRLKTSIEKNGGFAGVDYQAPIRARQEAEAKAQADAIAAKAAKTAEAYDTGIQRGAVTNPDTLAEDIEFAIADAQQLKAQGLDRAQIKDVLQASGMNDRAAEYLSKEVAYGTPAAYLRSDLRNMGGTAGDLYQTTTLVRPDDLPAEPDAAAPGTAGPVAPSAPAEPVTPTLQSSTATATGNALLDAGFVAEDAVNMAQAGLSKTQIRDNLIAAGVNETIATTAANTATGGQSADAIARNLSNLQTLRGTQIFPGYTPPAPVTGGTTQGGGYYDENGNFRIDIEGVGSIPGTELPPVEVSANPAQVTDAEFFAADALQLAGQGLTEDAIRQNLIYSGADPFAATQAAAAAYAGADIDAIIAAATTAAGGPDIYTATPPTSPVRNPAQVTEAEFVGYDAEDLHNRGLSQAQIESTLLYSGVDPLVAADAAALAAAGYNAATIAQNIEQSGTFVDPVTGNTITEIFTPGNAPAAALPGYQGEPGSEPGTARNPTIPVAMDVTPQPEPEAATTPEESVAGLTPEQAGEIVAADQAGRSGGTTTPSVAPYGSFTPAAPDPSWSIPLAYPGMNPGFMLAGVQPAYQTTSPVQSQYFWGAQPFMQTTADLANYNQVPMPAQPWGLQQGFFETPQPYGAGVPVYGENMFPVAPATRMAAQPGVYNLPEPATMQVTQQPYSSLPPLQNTQYPQPSAQPMTFSAVPMSAFQLPTQPGYIYDISPRADQYAEGFQPIAPTPVT